jgi:hypothetical protein
MALSVFRLRLVYSPFYPMLRPLRPLEGWVYTTLLKSPQPLPHPDRKEKDEQKEASAKPGGESKTDSKS